MTLSLSPLLSMRTNGFDFGFWILILILDFNLAGFCYGFCSTEVGGVTEKLDGGGGGGWLTEEEK